jgi:hypothetical protein
MEPAPRLLLEVVVQIEAEADTHEDPENGEPDQRSPANSAIAVPAST